MHGTRTWRPCAALGFSRPVPVLAQADLEEHEQHGAAEPERQQDERQQLTDQPRDQDGAQRSGDNEDRGRQERHDA
jgi:hypothetical protein